MTVAVDTETDFYVVSVVQPWATALALYGATVLNRPHRLPAKYLGGQVAIHAATYRDPFRERVERGRIRDRTGVTVPAALPYGAIVAVGRLTGCVESSSSPWFEGPFGWVVEDVRAVTPVATRGVVRVTRLAHDVAEILHSRLRNG